MSVPSQPTLTIGDRVDDHYTIERVLGGGAVGRVFKAHDDALRRDVAIKVLRRNLTRRLDSDARFRREARILSQLNHPNIVTVYAFGRLPSQENYIVMEFVEGFDLDELIAQRGALSPERVLDIARLVASAIGYAHRKGIVHRDLKPANIIITRAGDDLDLKVVDFGLAKDFSDDSELHNSGQHVALGSPFFMSPEQIQGFPLDGRADLYALGVMLTLLLTGRLPFKATSPRAYLEAHVLKPPSPPSLLRPDLELSPAIDDVVLRALAKEPDERYPDADALLTALSEAIAPTPKRPRTATFKPASVARTEHAFADVQLPLLANLTALHVDIDAHTLPSFEPALALDALELLQSRVQRVLEKHEGARLIGPLSDQLTLLFGVSDPNHHRTQAVDAALSLKSALDALRDDPTRPQGWSFDFRLALDTGAVAIRPDPTRGYALHGAPLTQTRRVAAHAEPGDVRITRALYRWVRDHFQCTHPRPAEGDLPPTRSVLQRRRTGVSSRPPHLHGLPIELIGRQRELDALTEAFLQITRDNTVNTVLLTGQAGVGKSTLARAFMRATLDRPEFIRFYAGRCHPTHHQPFTPFVEAMRNHARLDESLGNDEALRVTRRYVQQKIALDADDLSPREATLLDFVQGLFGLQSEAFDDDHSTTRMLDAMCDIFERLSHPYPMVLLIEDFHHASPTTRDLVRALCAWPRTSQGLLIILVQRADSGDALDPLILREARSLQHIRLSPMNDDALSAVVRHMLRALQPPPPEHLVTTLVNLSDGLPFIAEEAILDLIDQDLIHITGPTSWTLTADPGQLILPEAAEQLILQRIQRLDPRQRAILQATSIFEELFWPELAHAISPEATPEALFELHARGLLTERWDSVLDGDAAFTFTHNALRQHLLERLPADQRRHLNLSAAEWLERNLVSTHPGYEALVAHHFIEGGDPHRALHFTQQAAMRAARASLHSEAIQQLGRALALVEQNALLPTQARAPVSRQLKLELARQHLAAGHFEEALEMSRELALDLSPDDAEQSTRVALLEGQALERLGHIQDAREAYQRAERLAPAGPLRLQIQTAHSALLIRAGEPTSAARALQSALQERAPTVRNPALSRAYRTLGDAELARDHGDTAEEAYNHAYRLAITSREPDAIVEALTGLGALQHHQGDPQRARSTWADALHTAEERQLKRQRAELLLRVGALDVELGDDARARPLLEHAHALFDAIHARPDLARACALLAALELRQAKPEDALAWLQRLAPRAAHLPLPLLESATRSLAALHAQAPELEGLNATTEAFARALEGGYPSLAERLRGL